ncbi:MAG: hypothetical protein FWH14_04790 [Oscillospiraceae bacterium]|nr:hypothetical protein [Oscillospiraceae bacterium]
MPETINYPRKGLSKEDVINQRTFDRMTSELMNWRQGAGIIGGLYLHSNFEKHDILEKRYQGQTSSFYYHYVNGAMKIFDNTKSPRWRVFAGDIISNLLYLQCADGGFRHASKEFEPSYISGSTCPIHQFFPILALLSYAEWQYADPSLKELIKPAIDRHWEWFNNRWWMRGPGGKHPPMKTPGWCGVTNQDLTVIAALSRYGRVYGDMSRYEKWGKPALFETYLSAKYYHRDIGLFERGDAENHTERICYFHVIFFALRSILGDTCDQQIADVIQNCAAHLFDAVYAAPDGMYHLAWGAKTDPDDKSLVIEWQTNQVVINEHPSIMDEMELYLQKHPDEQKQQILNRIRESFYAYVFYDGMLPGALWPVVPLVTVASSPHSSFWLWMVEQLGDNICDPEYTPELCIHRKTGEYTWKRKGQLWAIEKNGKRIYGGYTPLAFGVSIGDQSPALGSYADLDEADVIEVINHA